MAVSLVNVSETHIQVLFESYCDFLVCMMINSLSSSLKVHMILYIHSFAYMYKHELARPKEV